MGDGRSWSTTSTYDEAAAREFGEFAVLNHAL
jgi:hypothetical protein